MIVDRFGIESSSRSYYIIQMQALVNKSQSLLKQSAGSPFRRLVETWMRDITRKCAATFILTMLDSSYSWFLSVSLDICFETSHSPLSFFLISFQFTARARTRAHTHTHTHTHTHKSFILSLFTLYCWQDEQNIITLCLREHCIQNADRETSGNLTTLETQAQMEGNVRINLRETRCSVEKHVVQRQVVRTQ